MEKPFSQACENNKHPILAVLREEFAAVDSVLEIGSGTGQHAVFFAEQMPWLRWMPTDRAENLPGIEAWRAHTALNNLQAPRVLDVTDAVWPVDDTPAIFSANTVHIMGWPEVERFFEQIGRRLRAGGVFCLYGPFNYGGEYTSASNAQFDQWLLARDPRSGIRDFEAIDKLARNAGLVLHADHAMPANNRTLVWRRV